MVIGANGIVNPSPGRPGGADAACRCWKWEGEDLIVTKRSWPRLAGVDNRSSTKRNNRMLFGDAKKMLMKCWLLRKPDR
jgi:NAD(P) transhydrogenase subunit beta